MLALIQYDYRVLILRTGYLTNVIKSLAGFPLENLPLLEIDGTVYTQSAAILRYLGKRFGLVAGDDIQDLRVDQVAEIVTDGRLGKLLVEDRLA